MITGEVLFGRVLEAEKYFAALRAFDNVEWSELYSLYLDQKLTVAESVALCHPRLYNESLDPAVSKIRGPRSFPSEPKSQTTQCGSSVFWGYRCVMTGDSAPAADHIFPFAYGGPTEPSNKLYLCAEHNRLKGCDVHLFPWNEGEPAWLSLVLYRVNYRLRRD